jgi:hypothetical protein
MGLYSVTHHLSQHKSMVIIRLRYRHESMDKCGHGYSTYKHQGTEAPAQCTLQTTSCSTRYDLWSSDNHPIRRFNTLLPAHGRVRSTKKQDETQ